MSREREKIIVRAGVVNVGINFVLAIFKIIVGLISNSIAIISDALHGLVDAVSGVIIIVQAKLTQRKSVRDIPKKIAQIELVATVLIVAIILTVGMSTLVESIKKIIEPEPVEYSVPVIVILIASIVGKLILGVYLKKRAKATSSDVLKASSVESLNDAMISVAVLISALIYVIFGVDIEAYVGIIISLIIIKLGVELVWENRLSLKQKKNNSASAQDSKGNKKPSDKD